MHKRLRQLLLTTTTLGTLALIFAFAGPGDNYFEITRNLDIFTSIYSEINTYYVDEVEPEKVINEGINEMLASLDPYTNYIPAEARTAYATQATGQYGGIGALVGPRNGKPTIIMPYPGYPAHDAGLKIGDAIVGVDGKTEAENESGDLSTFLKGDVGTTITLTIERPGQTNTFDVTLTRKNITINNVRYQGMVSEDVGYIRLTDFTTEAGDEVQAALIDLKAKGAKGIILDLRGNPGGLLSEAINVSNVFIPRGKTVLKTQGRIAEWNKSYKTLNEAMDTELPMAVLINSGSASAAEIVAGVIQDYDRGVLLGEKSFGKGLVQSTRQLPYDAQVKITTAKYYTPSGRCIQAIDYSLRNEDGSVGKVPDSLKSAFTTEAGRTVYDGGGIDPDIEVVGEDMHLITYQLLRAGHLFNYATKYTLDHETIAAADQFDFTDSDYQHFLNWLQEQDLDFESPLLQEYEALAEQVEEAGWSDNLAAEMEALKQSLKPDPIEEARIHQAQIKVFLKEEIISRYYLQQGSIQSSLTTDQVVNEAIGVLRDQSRYKGILSPQ